MQAGDRWRGLGALAASLALHAGVMLLLRPGLRPAAPPPPAIEIALVDHRIGVPPPPTAPGPKVPERATMGTPGRGPHGPARLGPRGGPGRAAPAPTAAPPAPLSGPAAEPGTDAWREAEGLGRGVPGRIGSELAIRGGLPVGERIGPEGRDGLAARADGGEGSGAGVAASPEVRAARVQARLDGYLHEVLAADRAAWLPDAYWIRLARQLEDGLSVEWGMLARGSPDDAVVSGTRAGQALEAWKRAAAAFGSTGQMPEGAARARDDPAVRPELPPPAERALFVTEVVTEVEIEQASGGGIVRWRLVRPSSNPAHDALVLARVAALAEEARRRGSLGPAPAQGRRTTWAVRTRFEMIPPMPVVGCEFDATFRPTGCFYPLKRTVKTRVRLERVWRE